MTGRRIGNYQITDYVGSGGFGSVFKAEDVNTPGRVVAIKELHKKHTRNAVIKQRFFQEAVAMARLDHPNLPRLFTFGEDNGSYYLVMEFISGKLLSDEIQGAGSLPASRAGLVIEQVLEALGYAHRNGIIHRDLKPDNIILIQEGSRLRIKVLDFGIARMVGGENLTLAGEGFGTPAYMSPERIKGGGGDDPRIDIYSAGIILFEMLSGKAPFESHASDPALYWSEMRTLHSSEPLPALSSLGVSERVEQLVSRATAKRLEDRYQTAPEMLADLRASGLLESVQSDLAPAVRVSTARLSVTTTPGDAEVYVDDIRRGVSDGVRGKLVVDGLSAGIHNVRVLKDGYNEYRINVALEEDRQTDLQVALPARATVAMPRPETTAAGGFDTLKLQGGDDQATALLVVESLPVGSTLFVGANAVAQAGEDGRATVRLNPGAHELRATSPSGASASSTVRVTNEDSGSLKTIALPLDRISSSAPEVAARSRAQSGRKRVAFAGVAVLLLALVAVAYVVIRGPGQPRLAELNAVSSSEEAPSTAAPTDAKSEPVSKAEVALTQQDAERLALEKRLAEAEKKLAEEKKAGEKPAEKPETIPPHALTPAAPPLQAPKRDEPPIAPTSREACVIVALTGPGGEPGAGLRIAVIEQPGAPNSTMHNGRANAAGRWQSCGFTAGNRVRVAVFGPRGKLLGGKNAVLSSGNNLIQISKTDQEPDSPLPLQRGPRRRFP